MRPGHFKGIKPAAASPELVELVPTFASEQVGQRVSGAGDKCSWLNISCCRLVNGKAQTKNWACPIDETESGGMISHFKKVVSSGIVISPAQRIRALFVKAVALLGIAGAAVWLTAAFGTTSPSYIYVSRSTGIPYKSDGAVMGEYARLWASAWGQHGYAAVPGMFCERLYAYSVPNDEGGQTFMGSALLWHVTTDSKYAMGCAGTTADGQPGTASTRIDCSSSSHPACAYVETLPSAQTNGSQADRPCPLCGGSADPVTGNNFVAALDATVPDSPLLTVARYDNSSPATPFGSVGVGWRSGFDYSVVDQGSGNVDLVRPDGRVVPFSSGVSTTDNGQLQPVFDASLQPAGWQYTSVSDNAETYDKTGRITGLTTRTQGSVQFSYDYNGRLSQVTDNHGRSVAMTYNGASAVASVSLPGGSSVNYDYTTTNTSETILSKVSRAGQTLMQYGYDGGATGVPFAGRLLTSVTDAAGVVQSTYSYDGTGRIVGLQRPAAGTSLAFTYGTGANTSTNQDGVVQTIAYTTVAGLPQMTSMQTACAANACGPSAVAMTFDANGNTTSATYANGSMSCTAYDLSRNLPVLVIENVPVNSSCSAMLATPPTTTPAKVTTLVWNSNFRVPTRIAGPMQVQDLTYDSSGRVLTVSAYATADQTGAQGGNAAAVGAARTQAFSYDGNGNLLTNTGVLSDVTHYQYGIADVLVQATNPLGQATTLAGYDAAGRVGSITWPNGAVTTSAYDVFGRMTSSSTSGETTSYTYFPTGLLASRTSPSGEVRSFTYDGAQRLTGSTDSRGRASTLIYNANGGVTTRQVADSTGAVVLTTSRVFDALNRVTQLTGAQALNPQPAPYTP